jgi:LCP family protein required for cell wall assembly
LGFLAPVIAFSFSFFTTSAIKNSDKATATPTIIQETKPIEDQKKKKYNILLLGEDDAAGLTDVLMIVSCDTESREINILQIPRDTYAEYTSASYRKMNAARDVLGGGEGVAEFLEGSLMISIDYHVTVDLEAVSTVVDALGGVEVDVPMDMIYKDPYQDLYIEIKKGRQLLDGEKAKQFIRYRSGYIRGDIDRLDAQKIFLSAILKKTFEQSNIFSVIEIIGGVLSRVESNISYNDCFNLIKALGVPDMKKVSFVTLPGGDIQGISGAWYYIMNRDSAYRVISEKFTSDISEAEFDPERKFTSTVRSGFNDIYESDNGYEPKIYIADEINGA